MSTHIQALPVRAPFKSGPVKLGHTVYTVTADPTTRRRFIGDEEVSAFIERMRLLGRLDVLSDLIQLGYAGLRASHHSTTAFSLHQARARA